MPLFLLYLVYESIRGWLSGGFAVVVLAYLWMVMMFQLARRDARLVFRKRNLVFQP